MKNNKKILKIFREDQKSRSSSNIEKYMKNGWNELEIKDKARRLEIAQIFKDSDTSFTATDYFMASMIYQHGKTIADSKRAVSFAKKSLSLDHNKAKWLYASSVDRLLMKQKKKQKFGTQFINNKKGTWKLYPVDPKTNDKERKKFGVIPLKKAKAKAENWNKRKINPWQEDRKTFGITSIK